jgi:3-isopropylmalate/(R)-2-methylmalate dehydratase small subunit
MALQKITKVTGKAVSVPGDDIDTDRIIPARFMKCVTFDGLGQYLFYDVRFDAEGKPKQHALNDPKFKDASILISGNNFGCGSSREHAPQAIRRAGFNAVIAEGFAEIFFGNSTTLGMPCVTASREDLKTLRALVENDPDTEVEIDLESMTIRAGDKSFPCSLRDSARQALTEGRWDPIADLLENLPKVESTAANLAYMQ